MNRDYRKADEEGSAASAPLHSVPYASLKRFSVQGENRARDRATFA